jgi:hypothetical protein
MPSGSCWLGAARDIERHPEQKKKERKKQKKKGKKGV